MNAKSFWAAAALICSFEAPSTVLASPWLPFGNTATINVTYSGVITSGYDTTGLLGTAGSLVGDSATIEFAFDVGAGAYSSNPSSSSLVIPGGAPGSGTSSAQWAISIGNRAETVGAITNGMGVDTAALGSTSQSATMALPQFNENFDFATSVGNPSIPSSILQNYSLDDIPLSVAFSLVGGECSTFCLPFDASGDLTSGDLSVAFIPPSEFTPPSTTPLPASLPLFVTGLSALGLLGWRRKRRRQAAVLN